MAVARQFQHPLHQSAKRSSLPAPTSVPASNCPNSSAVTIRVSGELLEGHLTYLDHLIQSANECGLWALLDLQHVAQIDRAALLYLVQGEGREFALVSCPEFIQLWIWHEHELTAA